MPSAWERGRCYPGSRRYAYAQITAPHLELTMSKLDVYRAGAKLLRTRLHKSAAARRLWGVVVRPALLRVCPDTLIGVYRSDERFEANLFVRCIRTGGTIVDIGANVGLYTLLAARALGNTGKVFAFEPAPQTFAYLKRNVRASRQANCVISAQALSNVTGPGRLYLSRISSGDHRIYSSGEQRDCVDIEMTRLDDCLYGKTPRIDVIKIDIQGAELAAVEGMSRLLAANRDLKLFTEFWPYGLKQFGTQPRSYLALLRSLGFLLYRIDEDEAALCEVNDDDILRTYTPENKLYTNLLAVRPQCGGNLPLPASASAVKS